MSPLTATHLFNDTMTVTGIATAVDTLQAASQAQPDIEIACNSDSGDILHTHTVDPMTLRRVEQADEPTVTTAHSLPETFARSNLGNRVVGAAITPYLGRFYRAHDHVIAPSPYVGRRVAALWNIPDDDITVIPHGIGQTGGDAPAAVDAFRRNLGIDTETPVVLGVGTMQPRKGMHTFLDVAEQVPEAAFVWAGKNRLRPFGFEYFMRQYRLWSAPDTVYTPGYIDDIDAAYEAADIFLFPSHHETFGLVILEAATHRLPVVLRDIPEYEGTFSTAARTADTTTGFVAVINELLQQPGERERQGERMSECAAQFTPEKMLDAHISLYQTLLDKNNHS